MKWLRYYLLTASIVAIGFVFVAGHDVRRADFVEVAAFLFVFGTLSLNAIYLLAITHAGDSSNLRIFRMFRLWLDAKERDSERRARHD